MGPGPGVVSLLLRRQRPSHPQRHLQHPLLQHPLLSRPLPLLLHPLWLRPLRLRHLILTLLLQLSRKARSSVSYLVPSPVLFSFSCYPFALFDIVRKDFVIDPIKHQYGRTGKSLAPQLLPQMRRDPPALVLRETAAKKLTHSYDGVGAR